MPIRCFRTGWRGIYSVRSELGMGLGHHLRLDPRGLVVPGGGDRPVCPQGGRLVHGQAADRFSGL